MIIVRMSGGIGNQLFQYATAFSLSKKHKYPLLLDTTSYHQLNPRHFLLGELISDLPILNRKFIRILVKRNNFFLRIIGQLLGIQTLPKVTESKLGYDVNIGLIDYPCYLKGSFISFKYFNDLNADVIKSLVFKKDTCASVSSNISRYINYNLVCVNIRRGDFLLDNNLNVCGISYFNECINKALELLDSPKFLFFSDDITWVKENFKSPYFYYWDHLDDTVISSLYAMTLCNHHIISNSSFGWWGAWLNNKTNKFVFCPSKVLNDDSFPVDDYYPANWIKIVP